MNTSIVINTMIRKEMKPLSTQYNIETILGKSEDTYDVSPIYQRDFVWKRRRQQRLIDSIVSGRAINAIHVCRKDNESNKFWVVDGKQRLSTIRSFYYGNDVLGKAFTVVVALDDGTERRMSFKQIEKLAEKDKHCSELRNRFLEYNIGFNIYDNLSLEEQKELFECINEAESLDGNEKIFCSNYVARAFYRRMYYAVFHKHLSAYLSKNYQNNSRDKGTRFVAEFLLISFGKEFVKDGFDKSYGFKIVDTTPAAITEVVNRMEKRLRKDFGFSGQDNFENLELADSIVGKKQMQQIEDCVKAFAFVLSDKKDVLDGKMKNEDKSWVMDCLCWIMSLLQKNVLTKSYIEEEYKKFYELFKNYQAWLSEGKNRELKQCGDWHKKMEARVKKLDETFFEPKNGFDVGVKNKKIPSNQTSILLAAPQNDPVTGRLLRAEIIDIDHAPAKSISSENKFVATDEHFNRKKGNMDADFAQRTADYQKEHEGSST